MKAIVYISKQLQQKRAARAAQKYLIFLIQPIKSLICGVGFYVAIDSFFKLRTNRKRVPRSPDPR